MQQSVQSERQDWPFTVELAHRQANHGHHAMGVPDSARYIDPVVQDQLITSMQFSWSSTAFRTSQSAQSKHLNQVLLRWLIAALMALQSVYS